MPEKNKRRDVLILSLIVAILLSPATVVVAETLTHDATSGVTYQTNSGLEVTLTDDREVQAVPFVDSETWEAGALRLSSAGPAEVSVGNAAYDGSTITLTSIDAESNSILINRSDIDNLEISGSYNQFSYNEIDLVDEQTTEISYTGANNASINLSDLGQTGVAAVDANDGTVYDSALPTDGQATLSLPDGDADISIQRSASKLKIYNESNPGQLVNNSTITVELFGETTTDERTTSDGVIDFSGLPVDEEFTLLVDGEGYNARTIVIDSLSEQSNIFLLPESEPSVEVRFRLADSTGTFDSDSNVYLEKPVTINNSTEYQTITADNFGANGFTTVLSEGDRYDIRIRNERGTTAQLSSYTPTVSETVTLEPNAAAVQKPENEAIGYEVNYDKDAETVTIEYIDPTESTESLTVSVKARNSDNVLRAEQTYADPSSLSLSVPTNGTLQESYYVNMTGQRGSESIDIQETVGPRQQIVTPTQMPIGWQQLVATMSLLLMAGVFSQLNVGVGVLVTSLWGGVLWFFGLMSGMASGAAVGLAIGIATLNLLREGGP